MTDYVAQAVSKATGSEYYVNVSGRNQAVALEKLYKQRNEFYFFIYTKALYIRHVYQTEFLYEKYDEDGSLNEYRYVEWERLPQHIKKYYRNEAMKKVIEVSELKW